MEWTIVSTLVVIIGLIATVAKPMISLQKSITSLEYTIKALDRRLSDYESITKRQEEKIENHEVRITVLEEKSHKTEKKI